MILRIHIRLLRWAVWTKEPCGNSMGYGSTITAKICEGKGMLLPGAPRGSGPILQTPNHECGEIEMFLGKLKKKYPKEFKLIRVFYLQQHLTGEEKAAQLRMGERTMYNHLDRIHRELEVYLERKLNCIESNL